jgi:hypothetical protein
MGGCIRNLVTERPIKDIDIFLSDERDVVSLVKLFNLDIERPPIGHDANGGGSGEGEDLQNMKVWKCGRNHTSLQQWETRWDVIWVPSIAGRREQFPDYISRMWLDWRGNIHQDPQAVQDKARQRIRYFESIRPTRLARLKELYEDWSFECVNPTALEIVPRKRNARKGEDHAPFWWEMTPPSPDRAMDAVRAMCKG